MLTWGARYPKVAQQAALFAHCLNVLIDEFLHDNQNIKNMGRVASCFLANGSLGGWEGAPSAEPQGKASVNAPSPLGPG